MSFRDEEISDMQMITVRGKIERLQIELGNLRVDWMLWGNSTIAQQKQYGGNPAAIRDSIKTKEQELVQAQEWMDMALAYNKQC